jgi:hypothetical protein
MGPHANGEGGKVAHSAGNLSHFPLLFASCRFLPSCHALIGQVTVSTVGSSFGQAISYGGRTSVLLTVDLGSEANSFYLFLAQYQLAETRLRP